ncbi:MAG: hypothetical protein NC429_00160 [Lachnospiraceae bacterium]|nr:hypothetical protein [Lachnospiraceae bacterium]
MRRAYGRSRAGLEGLECGDGGNNMFGIRTFFALPQNSDVKFLQEWYDNMLALEMKVCDLEGHKDIALFSSFEFGEERVSFGLV